MNRLAIIWLQKLIKLKNKFKSNKSLHLIWNEKILFIKLDRIGDACWTIAQSKIIKQVYPSTQIYILANNYNWFVFKKFKNLFKNIYIIPSSPPNYLLQNPFGDIIKWLKNLITIFWKNNIRKTYDICINQTNRIGYFIEKYIRAKEKIKCWKHKEIWATSPWCNLLDLTIKNYNFDFNIKIQNKNILLFKWWKNINKLSNNQYNNIKSILQNLWFNIKVLNDHPDKNSDYILSLKKNGFFVNNIPLEKFIKKFDLIIWIDWWVMHYATLFHPWLIIYTTTNLLSTDYVKKLANFDNRTLYKSKTKYALYLWLDLDCHWCFQIWCQNPICKNITSKQITGIMNFLIKKSIN